MKIAPFATEQFFAQYEFSTPYNLCASDCETTTATEVLQLAGMDAADLLDLRLGYTESQGNPALRELIAGQYDHVMADEVVCLSAPEEGIYLLMRTLLEPGDHIVVLTPAYDSLLNLAEHVSGNVSRWEIRPTKTGWRLDLDELSRLVTAETRLVVVNFPHNPTGLLPSPDEFTALIDIVRARGAWLFCDEMYRGLERDSVDRLPSAVDQYERAIILAGLSKTHGLPGLRTGWLVVRDPVVREALINWKHYTTICPPAPSELLATAALRAHQTLVERSRAIIAGNLALVEPFFDRHADLFHWRPPLAGSVALVGLNMPSATAYCRDLAREAGVLLLPGRHLGYDDQSIRFGFGRVNFLNALEQYEGHLLSQS
jgi:aspartate/methionine/tyrosine aminotransferase